MLTSQKNIVTNKILAIIITSILLYGCNNKTIKNIKTDYSFLVISDVHISSDENKDVRLAELVEEINELYFKKFDAIFFTGDNVSSFYKNKNLIESNNNRVKKLYTILKKSKVPYYLTLGNHDYKIDSNKDSDEPFTKTEIDQIEKLWKKFTSIEPYYLIKNKGWNFIVLNSMRGKYLSRNFDNEQISFLKESLKNDNPTILFFHHPIQTDNFKIWCKPKDLVTEETEQDFFKVLEEFKHQIKGIFVGHGHMWQTDTIFDSIKVFETDSFADNENSPYYIVGVDTTKNTIQVSQREFRIN
ncbi:MAG: metallophosphoesterase [Ignavibacteriales bacterium]|nr:metallophosphoesterase [Ignavibacteriales bacterium]MCB9219685.1 metallophosphoesterase [Ignavibacteriales bacterium]MCB9259819.1 metallophosphoesterase [Ignavibacteriales bacterium]